MPASTLDIELSDTVWTLVVANGSKGLVSNPSNGVMIMRKNDTLPASNLTTGHPIGEGESFVADLTDAAETGNVYMRISSFSKTTGGNSAVFTES